MAVKLINGQLVPVPDGVETLPSEPGQLPFQRGVGDVAMTPDDFSTTINSNPIGNGPRAPGPTPNSSTGAPYAEATPSSPFEFATPSGGQLTTPNSSTGAPRQVAPRMGTPSSSLGTPGSPQQLGGGMVDPETLAKFGIKSAISLSMSALPLPVRLAIMAGTAIATPTQTAGKKQDEAPQWSWPNPLQDAVDRSGHRTTPVIAPPGSPPPPGDIDEAPRHMLPPIGPPQAAFHPPGAAAPTNVPLPPSRPGSSPASGGGRGGGGRPAPAAAAAPAPEDINLGHYRASVGNARGQTWVPAGMDNVAPQMYRGPLTMWGASDQKGAPVGSQNYYIPGSAPMGKGDWTGTTAPVAPQASAGRGGGRGGGSSAPAAPVRKVASPARAAGMPPGPMDPSIAANAQRLGINQPAPGPINPSIIARSKTMPRGRASPRDPDAPFGTFYGP
jgi:hypothetical protein